MRLYRKKLKNIDDLRKEKAALKGKLREIESEGFLPFTSKKQSSEPGKKDILSTISDFFFTNPFADLALSLGKPLAKKAGKKTAKTIFSLGKDVLGGYAKWKAIELGYRWSRRIFKARKERHSDTENK